MSEKEIKMPDSDKRYFWDLSDVAFSLLPLAPGTRRKTLIEEIVPDSVWTLDQIQGIISVNVPVRSAIFKLSDGGLLVYNPVGPTRECIELVRDLEEKHGKVQHIILGSVGLEHKSFVGPFSRFFPLAKVWIQPGQWSFPVNLPNAFLGFPLNNRVFEIPKDSKDAPWFKDFDHAILGPLTFKSVGGFGETAFFHRKTNTLLVTDAVVRVSDAPPAIIEEDPRAILFHSRDNMLDSVKDTREARLRGWRRMVLFGLFFFPSGISVKGVFETFSKIPKLDKNSKILGKGSVPFSGGLYPWSWEKSEISNFKQLQGGLLVAPILRELILNREPTRVLEWAEKVGSWPIKRIIPSHLENNIPASGKDFKNAFSFLKDYTKSSQKTNEKGFNFGILSNSQKKGKIPNPDDDDLSLLKTLSSVFTKFGIVAPIPRE